MMSKNQIQRAFLGAIVGAALPVTAFGSGFQINEHSAINTGKAGASTATVKDPSAIWHNPAGLTSIEGTEFSAGVTFIRPRGSYTGPGLPSTNPTGGEVTNPTTTPIVPVPYAYVARQLSSKAYVGFGFYAPYGLGIEWANPDTFVQRTTIQELSLRTFFLTPAIALKLSDNVSVAVGVSLVPATLYLKRTLGAADNGQVLFPTPQYSKEGTVELSATAFGVGATAGLQVTLVDHLKLGLAFRSAVDLSFSGNANFDVPTEAPTAVKYNFPDQEGSGDLTLPHTFAFGVGWDQGPLSIEAATQITLWTSYDELRLNFASGRPAPSSVTARDWVVVPIMRLGGAYQIDDLTVRAGLAYDVTPVPDRTVDATLPDNNRFITTLGVGYSFGAVRLDLAYMNLWVFGRDLPTEGADVPINSAPGSYDGGFVHLFSASVGVKI